MNAIVHGTHHIVAVCDIFNCTLHMEGGNMNNSKFIRNVLKGIMDELDTRQELSDLINFDGAKVLQVTGEILNADCTNLTCMLFTLNGTNTCFMDIGKL